MTVSLGTHLALQLALFLDMFDILRRAGLVDALLVPLEVVFVKAFFVTRRALDFLNLWLYRHFLLLWLGKSHLDILLLKVRHFLLSLNYSVN